MRIFRLANNRGSALLLCFVVALVFSTLAFVLYTLSMKEMAMAEKQRQRVVAFHIAEAGIEQAVYDLRLDFINSKSWTDGDINGLALTITNSFQPLPYTDTSLNNGSYLVELKKGDASFGIWIKSTGIFEGVPQTIQVYGCLERHSIWDNAVYAGSGQHGGVINGNVSVMGSVHILGSSLAPVDYAIDLSGVATLAGNNYTAMPADLRFRIPALDSIVYNGENIETLHSTLRVKRGQVNLGGTGQVGETNVIGNIYKETADAAFVNDGFVEHSGPSNVHADEMGGYDLGDMLSFPEIGSDGDPESYASYFRSHAYVVSDPVALAELSSITPESIFAYGDSQGMIAMDGDGHMTVSGCVYIEGDLNLKTNPSGLEQITYEGSASILVKNDVSVNVGLVTPNASESFPDNILGVMTPGSIRMGETSQKDIMGLFYAENNIRLKKQTNIIGTLVSNYFDLSHQVPSVFQVPDTVDNLPPRLIGGDPLFLFKIISWQRL